MASSPPGSPAGGVRPMSAMITSNRSSSRMSVSSRHGRGGSRASDEDSKTAVKVAVRVRPPVKPTDPGYDLVPQRFRGSTCQVTSPTNLGVESAQGKKLFVFDRVFSEDVDQEGVWEYLSESVNSFAQGYNVSILAYGQSGAGKSYTMGTTGQREQNDATAMGIVPRAAAALFEKLTGQGPTTNRMSGLRTPARYSTQGVSAMQPPSKPANKNWQMKATYVEIYNEQLRDLLVEESIPFNERTQVSIREDPKGRILLTGLRQVTINSIDDLLGALNFGSAIRQTDATAVNAKSSRSHAVFSLNLVQKRAGGSTTSKEKRYSVPVEAMSGSEGWVTVDSKLHFVDLAGSERLKNTGAQGERAKEGISINAGLASLGKVIAQLSSRHPGSHVSYRDSKLTRLLQDSLGGNAITYMVACVNPAEFHLSETLNTVQYAQRARAIQSKPQIQQVNDDSDKQAAIDRLRAEVSFLRDQIRLSERTDRRNNAPQERAERQNEREMELQNQLLDMQENYNALSQRHAKLIAEIAKDRESDAADLSSSDYTENSALDRIKRSSSFAEAVEQVVLEYEKTIQSLELSLSNTRGTLASSESNLLEKETRLAYMETVQQQLQSRIQKAMDREANDGAYVRDLESRFAGATTVEEKSNAAIQGLRQELARARENEANCEEYISTLEERLAEAEQDQEMMQREMERLEHIIERQRGINKLDNLLYELDHIRQAEPDHRGETKVNGHTKHITGSKRSTLRSERAASIDTALEDKSKELALSPTTDDDDNDNEAPPVLSPVEENGTTTPRAEKSNGANLSAHIAPEDMPHSPAQSKFVADKLETVTQELFDLRVEHESTINEFDDLNTKYQLALKTLAEMEDAVSDARRGRNRDSIPSRPTSFLAHAEVNELDEDGQPSSSRTLSSELSLAGESTTTVDSPLDEVEHDKTLPADVPLPDDDQVTHEMAILKKLNAEKEDHVAELKHSYTQLQTTHQDTLDYVEELKSEIQKAQLARPASPSTMRVIRRKSSQNISASDRANRSFVSLQKIAQEHFEEEPDTLQNFELNLGALRNELATRTERVADLETEMAAVRKEIDAKMTIISGLARERSSLKSTSPMDISVVSQLQDQLLESENKIRQLHESHAAREQQLLHQVDSLKGTMTNGTTDDDIDGDDDSLPEETRITNLRQEVSQWRTKHDIAVSEMKHSQQLLQDKIAEMETAMRKTPTTNGVTASRDLTEKSESDDGADDEVVALRKEVDEHKANAVANATRFTELEQSYSKILAQIDEDTKARGLTEKELQTHRDLVVNLETQLEEHKSAISLHQQGLTSLQESHARELNETSERLTKDIAEHKGAAAALQEQLAKTQASHEEATTNLKTELEKIQGELDQLTTVVSKSLGMETDSSNLHVHILALLDERKDLLVKHEKATDEQVIFQNRLAELDHQVQELKIINEETVKELLVLSEKEKKSSRLVEELEEQLNSNYDQHQAANNRLSALQGERQLQLEEALQAKSDIEHELEESRAKISQLETQLENTKRGSHFDNIDPTLQRSNSGSGASPTLRKSASHTSLPSPPPAIPLPPLPGTSSVSNAPSPPTSRHQSKDLAQAQLVEDQEVRIRTIEKHLIAEKQLTATLEEALTDLETSSTKLKGDLEAWRRKCAGLEEEVSTLKKQSNASRYSLQQVEEERSARMKLEADRAQLEARMQQLANANKKKKKTGGLNCF